MLAFSIVKDFAAMVDGLPSGLVAIAIIVLALVITLGAFALVYPRLARQVVDGVRHTLAPEDRDLDRPRLNVVVNFSDFARQPHNRFCERETDLTKGVRP